MSTRVLALVCLLLAASMTCCAADPTRGYSTSGFFGDENRSVAVSIFENETFETGLEFQLTEAVVKEINARTPWSVSQSSSASTSLSGRIVSVEQVPLSTRRGTGLVEEVALRVTIDFEWRDNRSGRTLVSRRGFAGSGTFVPARAGGGEAIEIGQAGALSELARSVVNEMRNEW